jgi:hypothetical protein
MDLSGERHARAPAKAVGCLPKAFKRLAAESASVQRPDQLQNPEWTKSDER